MNDIDIIRLTSGLLQFGVACYALRLGRLFKSTLAGWLLFSALSVLALLSLFFAVEPFDAGAQWGIKVDILYSLLLLAGVMRFYSGLQNFLREEEARREALDKWESQVKEQWMELIKANEKLRQTVNRLEAEVAERKQAQEQGEKNLQELLAASRQNEKPLPPAATGLETEVIERKPTPAPTPAPAPAPAPAETNSERPLTAPQNNGGESWPVTAGFDTEIITQKPAPGPAEKNGEPEKTGELETNGEHLVTPSRNNGEGLQPIALAPTRNTRKTAARKPSRTRRKKPALTR